MIFFKIIQIILKEFNRLKACFKIQPFLGLSGVFLGRPQPQMKHLAWLLAPPPPPRLTTPTPRLRSCEDGRSYPGHVSPTNQTKLLKSYNIR